MLLRTFKPRKQTMKKLEFTLFLVNITDGAGGSLAAGAADVDFNVQLTVNLTTFLLMLSTSCLHF